MCAPTPLQKPSRKSRARQPLRSLPSAGTQSSGSRTQHDSIPRRSLNGCPCFWPKVQRFGHLSLEGAVLRLGELLSASFANCYHPKKLLTINSKSRASGKNHAGVPVDPRNWRTFDHDLNVTPASVQAAQHFDFVDTSELSTEHTRELRLRQADEFGGAPRHIVCCILSSVQRQCFTTDRRMN